MKPHARQTCFFVSVLFLCVTADLHSPEVHTKLGSLRGEYVRVKGKDAGVHAFLGVPFAKPPVGPSLRLAAPQPADAWEGVRDATKQPPMCIQNDEISSAMLENFGGLIAEIPDISEDCLYLNIYTPANRAHNAKLPVMVWIHGGGFVMGSASTYDGSAMAAYQDVVVVLIQYRLGILGFLSTGDEHMSGNFGLLDQVQALRWVKDNIHSFGGNPDLVTIFGESAGGISVSLLSLSPLSDGLFHRAIAESGTAAIDFFVGGDPVPVMQVVANSSGCSLESTKKISECMRSLDIDTLITLGKNPSLIVPVNIDGHFLTKPVNELFEKHEIHTVPFMTGINDHEGGYLMSNIYGPPNWTGGMDREYIVDFLSMFYPNPKDAFIKDLIVNEYVGNGEDRVRNRDGFTEIIGDVVFNTGAIKTANAHSDAGAPVYLYECQYPLTFMQKRKPSFVRCDHADEVFMVLGFCFTTTHVKLTDPCTEEEQELSRNMMSYWGNFARTGSPNGDGLVHWPKYGADEEYLSIDLKEQVAAQHLKKKQFIFFTEILPEKIQQHKEALEVHTKLGGLRGEYVRVKGRSTGVHAFLGVPFAKPPVGPSLRLAAPQPADAWEGVRDATKQPPMCIQNVEAVQDLLNKMDGWVIDLPDISEDCLYLNIYTPANRDHNAKLPVMVWIHGGAFSFGSASTYDGSAMAAYQDVVVVLIQYRLGILGFLSTGDEHMSGNFGLLDQVQALRWVKENIHSFGGNPDLVTIFGESAGGVSVSLLSLSPLSDGLFHRAIAESGTAAIDLLVGGDPVPVMQVVANASGCSLESTKKIGECMRSLDLDTLITLGKNPNLLVPVNVDGHFLTKPVNELFEKHELLTVPFMTGINNDEGGFLLAQSMAPQNWPEGMDRDNIVDLLSMFYPNPKDGFIKDLIVNEYVGTGEDRVRNRDGFTELIGDLYFTIGAIKTANAHRDAGAPVYLYEYQHPPSVLQKNRPSFVRSDHGDEIFMVQGFCFTTTHVKLSDPCTEEEQELSRNMMSYWGNFARTGSPNGDGLVHWPKYGADEEYLSIDLKEQEAAQHLRKNRFIFFTEILPEKIQQHKEALEVHTKLGGLSGEYVRVKGRSTGVHAFLGVPFAKPPVGPSLRLAAPQPADAWEGVRDATKQPPMCIQNVEAVQELLNKVDGGVIDWPDISEDCLYLNIYTPANRAHNAKLPVMVWIHGGGFAIGSASTYDGSAMAAYQDVVVVLIQYRLGILGFLSTGDEHMSGNFGLLDQVQALRWVKENIHSFGGNPDLVTIFGESAGGTSVSLLSLSPLSDGLFHRAIAESGTAAIDFFLGADPVPVMQVVANASGCSLESTKKIGECMRSLDLDTLITLVKNPNLFVPVIIDGHFLTKPVNELFEKHELLTVPFMTGINNDEGGFLLALYMAPQNWTEGMDRDNIVDLLSMFYPNPKDAFIKDLIVNEYAGTGEDRVRNRDGFTELIGDMFFTIGAIKTANGHRDAGAPVYLYEYQHPPLFLQKKRPSFVRCDHGDEVYTVLGSCFTTTNTKLTDGCPKEEEELSKTVMSYWGNFARAGSPNGDGLVHWPKYGADEEYLSIDLKEQLAAQHLRKNRFIFFTEILPEKIQQHKEALEVHTKLGSLSGEYVRVKGRSTGVHAFLGVPFAKPPVGPSLRLAAPQPADAWEGVRDATKQPPMCIQNVEAVQDLLNKMDGWMIDLPDISEDCLYLNIYTPANRAHNAKLPVMVWIHGGGFSFGSASMYDGSAMAAYQDVVVVLIQYRLGILGFLSTGDEHMSGNFGLLDQVQALRWVKENIHSFGGNPDLVTIFGESAGGVSVSLLSLSPLSDGLFHRAIAESGTAAIDLLVGGDPVPVMQVVANASGCSLESTKKIGECMRSLDLDTLITLGKNPNLLVPVNVDGHFLTKPVNELFEKHELLTVPFMTGINNDEGGFLLAQSMAPQNWPEGMDRDNIVDLLSMFYPNPKDAFIKDLIVNEYVGTGEDRVRNRDGFTEFIGDMYFTIGAIQTANAHRDAGAPVYLYEYQHPLSVLQKNRPSFVGSDHLDEIFMVQGFCFTTTHAKLTDPCTEEEQELSRNMMSYWGNFARTGSPNGDGLVHWPKYGADEEYLSIDLKEQVAAQHLRKNRFIFFTEILPEKIRQHEEALEVHTKLGGLSGEYVRVKGRSTGVHAFLGVPFAKPPVGPSLRLAAPQPADAWEGVRDATKQPPMCIQNVEAVQDLLNKVDGWKIDLPDISEDCLYLNIYTPANRAHNAKLPVMVWIHGGGFAIGSASVYDGSAMAAYQDVVVVLIQYRLGILGFLSTGDEHMSGNFGLLDQVQALRWVKENIHSFGGNPDLVTIFGESAGGVSVSLLSLSPLSDGLFHRAIAESGTAAIDVLVGVDPVPVMQVVANASGCSLESTKKIGECMRSLDLDTLITLGKNPNLLVPVNIDGHFLTKPVNELFEKHELLTVPFMTGINNDEGGFLLAQYMAPQNWTEGMDRDNIVDLLSMLYPNPKDAFIKDLIVNEYAGNGEDRVRNRDGFTELIGDLYFTIGAIKTANAHRDAGAPVYLYEYQHPPSFLQKQRPSFVRCDHGDEIFTVLGLCFTTTHTKLTDGCPEEEEELSKTVMSHWGNFARTGSPNGDGLVHWPKYGADEEYLSIDLKEQVAAQHLKKNRFIFFTEILPEKIRQHKETAEHSEL